MSVFLIELSLLVYLVPRDEHLPVIVEPRLHFRKV